MKRTIQNISAENKTLGRLASEIAVFLQGKHKPDFFPYKDMGDMVVVKDIDKLKFSGKKFEQKKYYRHSGYMGGLKETILKKLYKQKPKEVLRKTVLGMLPKNKLRSKIIKRLIFE